MANKLIFKDAEAARDAIMDSQKKEIAALYESWADEIGERAKFYSHKSTASAPVSERYYRELQKQLRATSQEISNEVYNKIKTNIYTVADAVIADNVKWLESFGFSKSGLNAAFSYVPDEIVRNLITGQIYDSGWSLSARIWGDNEQTLKDIYQVMAKGLAENKPIYEIAKDLEKYVRPSAKLPWNLRAADGVKIYKKQVDYNAQRLARTLVQHGYQQSFVAATQKNPFITEYVWLSNGSRVCDLCKARDGVHYKKTELPLDHPNGMCTMEPVVASDMIDRLADWFNSPDGTYPEIDEFAGNFGYQASKGTTVKDFISKYGKSDKSLAAWHNSMSPVQKAEAKMLKEQAGQTWQEFYEQNIYTGVGSSKPAKVSKTKKMVFNDDAMTFSSSAKSKLSNVSKFDQGAWDDMIEAQRDRNFLTKMRQFEDSWEGVLTDAEKKAVYAYTRESSNCYRQQNGYLRFGQDVSPTVKNTVKKIQSALDKSVTTEDMMLVRGTKKSLYTDIFNGELKNALDKGDVDSMVGHLFKDPGFLSTSPNGDEFGGDLKFKIFAPAGTKGGYVENNNYFGEREFLLQSNTTYYIEKAEKNSRGDITLYLRIVV